jgi:uncharacterized protein
VVVGVDGTVIEPHHPQLRRVDIGLRRLPQEFDGFTIAQLSDFHYDPHFCVIPITAAIKVVNGLTPDLIALTGDFVTVPLGAGDSERRPEAARDAQPCARLLGELRAKLGSVAVLGNHDYFSDPEEVTAALQASGIRVLRNGAFPVERNKAVLWLAGVDDALGGAADLKQTLRQIPSGDATILMCHEPDFADEAAGYEIDVQLSGHSHGGQIRLPLIGPPFLPPMGKKYPWGLRQIRNMMLYTNCGIGTIRLPVRWNCPPEITLLTLRSKPQNA